MSSFFEKLNARSKECDSLLCVGLDPHWKEIFPGIDDINSIGEEQRCDVAYTFCKSIIELTAPHAAAYKPNAAFFEALGPNLGTATLRRIINIIPDDIPVLLDVKRGDIGSTAAAYADACFEKNGLDADGVTLSPLMGWDSVKPFVTGKYKSKGAFVLCKTSNPGSNDILALTLNTGETVYEKIAHLACKWSDEAAATSTTAGNTTHSPCIGLVVGATDAVALSKARKAAGPSVWILAPGVGAQGGDLDAACAAGMNAQGSGLLIPVSRGISQADNPAKKAQELKENINNARAKMVQNVATALETGASVADYQKEFLEFSLSEGVLKFGSFVLKSGRTSPYFFNAGLFATGGALYKLGRSYAAAIMASGELVKGGSVLFDVIFGPAYKGISLGAVVCAALFSEYDVDVGFAYNRKEAKDHGEGGMLVGASMKAKRVLVIDDVITAGTAIRESHTMLTGEGCGAIMMGVVIALDRAEKRSLDDPISAVQAVARDLRIPVVSIVSLPQLQSFLSLSPDYADDILVSVDKYRTDYGV